MKANIPLSLYVHIPWCVRKCPYCDFNSHEAVDGYDEIGYVDALLGDLAFELQQTGRRPLQSIFIGGGTPSLFSGAAIARLMAGIAAQIDFASDIEITLEANPGTADAGHFAGYREAGVNRLSIGAQSFDAAQLGKLGRIHDPGQIQSAFTLAQQAGFDNINLDLMFALPGQSADGAIADLQQAIALQPAHLSWYQLTLEPNTRFYHSPPLLPEDDAVAAMQEQGQQVIAAAGYHQYEVSAYARAGRRCQHNLNYWQFGDYLGIGAGAHGKVTQEKGIFRRWRRKSPRDFVQHAGTAAALSGSQQLAAADLQVEFMLNALRLNAGVPIELFTARTGLPAARLAAAVAGARQRALLDESPGHLRATTLGFRFLNDLICCFDP